MRDYFDLEKRFRSLEAVNTPTSAKTVSVPSLMNRGSGSGSGTRGWRRWASTLLSSVWQCLGHWPLHSGVSCVGLESSFSNLSNRSCAVSCWSMISHHGRDEVKMKEKTRRVCAMEEK